MMDKTTCIRCGGRMSLLGRDGLQKGSPGWRLRGTLEHTGWEDLLPVELWCCSDCRRLDFYLAEPEGTDGSGIAKIRCPVCGCRHEMDDARCPSCGTRC